MERFEIEDEDNGQVLTLDRTNDNAVNVAVWSSGGHHKIGMVTVHEIDVQRLLRVLRAS